MLPLVGWQQSYNPARAIDSDLTESESGLYFQGAHPLCTLDNIHEIMPEDWAMQYAQWEAGRYYAAGVVVTSGGQLWQAVSPSTGAQPAEGSQFWRPFNMLSDYVRRLTLDGIAQVVQMFVQIKQLTQETRSLLERRTLFDGAGRLAATIENRHRLVGFEIVPVRSMGVTAKIERVGLQFAGGPGIVKLYLFHSSQAEPVRTYELNYSATNGSFQWFTLPDCYLPYMGDTAPGGAWFLCYDQDALPLGMEAINVSKDWSREPCGSCNMGSVETWRELTKYLQVSPFAFGRPANFDQNPQLWDIARNLYTNTTSYGLNCEISVGCDITDFIISSRHAFATVLQRQVAANALRTMAMNPNTRVNRNQVNVSRNEVLYELDGNPQGRPGGLGHELREAYKAINIDTRGLDRVCLTCNNHGVKYRSV